jgi:prepilin-type N-terminal cleavage/methylation domain-containing protein
MNRRRGFTLIEVLAALVMLGIVLPIAMKGVSIALASASHARHMSEAASLADEKLNEIIATQDWSTTSGDFGPDFAGYQWTVTTADRDYDVTEIQLSVTWTERGSQRSLNASTMVLNAASTDQGTVPSLGLQGPSF